MATSISIMPHDCQLQFAMHSRFARQVVCAGRRQPMHPTAPHSRFVSAYTYSVQTDLFRDPTVGEHLEITVPFGNTYRNDRTKGAFPCAVLAYNNEYRLLPNRCEKTPIVQFPTVERTVLERYQVDFPPNMHPYQVYVYIPPVDWTKPIAAEREIDEDTVPPTVPIPAPVETIPDGVRGPVRHVRRARPPTEPTRLQARPPKWSSKYQQYLDSIRNK